MTLLAVDPGSLNRLHDVIAPPPAPWWPLAPAWYLLLSMIVSMLVAVTILSTSRWRRDRYRREGLAELESIRATSHGERTISALAELVKRVALVAYPRSQVASLSGRGWLQFLDDTVGTTDFTEGPGMQLEQQYLSGYQTAAPELFVVIRHWIRHHRSQLSC